MRKLLRTILLSLLVLILIGCDKNTDGPEGSNQNSFDLQYGNIRFDFPLDDKYGAGRCTNRTDLSISYTADSLYRKEYLTSANLSDYQGTYTFI
ncbi:MAG: hypothetical protein U9N86_13740, partial [Bacteroidota bacterium]|nr:hypothetical protein [Bacteroidota bacterium]